jgi:hypothetical protein
VRRVVLVSFDNKSLQDHDAVVMSILERSNFETLHRMFRVTMHSNARAVFSQVYRGLLEWGLNSPVSANCSDVIFSELQQTNALLQNTDLNWVEMKIHGNSHGAPSRAPGPNGMTACACSTRSGGHFSFLCLLVDASSVSFFIKFDCF